MPTVRPERRFVLIAAAASLVAGAVVTASNAEAARGAVRIVTLSNRADLVSAGDVLVRISTPRGTDAADAHVRLNGRDVTQRFRQDSDGHGTGLLTGLRLGSNTVTATLPDGRGARLTVTNHPQGGPVFSGPQIQPWTCGNGSKSKTCDEKPTYSYSYLPSGTEGTTIGATGVAS